MIEELTLGECTLRRCANADGTTWWNLWFRVARETDGVPEVFEVPVIPRGAYTEAGPGGRSWGLNDQGGGVWQVSPSINVVNTGNGSATHPGDHSTLPSLWHKTPSVEGVPTGEPWQ